MSDCILCGTEIEDDFCYECDYTARELGFDYISLTEAL